MRAERPIFHASSRVPLPVARGIAIVGPEGPVAPRGNAAWIHGALILDPEAGRPDRREAWLRSLVVTAVRRDGEAAHVKSLVGGARHDQDHTRTEALADGAEVVVLPFAFELGPTLGLALDATRYHVWVSAREHRSGEVLLTCEEGAAGERLEGPFPGESPERPVDWLIQAYALARSDRPAEAGAAFAEALQEPAVREDLDRGALYDAACLACRTVVAAHGQGAEQHVRRAIEWLAEDLRRRRELLSREHLALFDAEVAGVATPRAAARVTRLREETVAHFARAHREDDDLELLHGMPDFEALFAPVQD